jgi:hypothetical protein
MNTQTFEKELSSALDHADGLIGLCAAGRISFQEFCVQYDNFYLSHALDGHESDQAELAVLSKFAGRIAPHRTVADTILGHLCDDSDASKESYGLAGRFGSREAIARIKLIAAELSQREA